MRISDKQLEVLRRKWAREVAFYCGAFGLRPGELALNVKVARGFLSATASWSGILIYHDSWKVGILWPISSQYLLISFRLAACDAFHAKAELVGEAA